MGTKLKFLLQSYYEEIHKVRGTNWLGAGRTEREGDSKFRRKSP